MTILSHGNCFLIFFLFAAINLCQAKVSVFPSKKPDIPTTESLRRDGLQRERLIGLTAAEAQEVERRYRVIEQERLSALSPEERKAEKQKKRDAEASKRKQHIQDSIDLLEGQIASGTLTADQVAVKKRTLVDILSEKLQTTLPGSDEESGTRQKLDPLMTECLSNEERNWQEQRLAKSRKSRAESALFDNLSLTITDKPSTASAQCDQILDVLASAEETQVNTRLLAATVYNLRGNADKALPLIKDAVAKHGDELAPDGIVHVFRTAGKFWVGTIARHSGRTKEAMEAYGGVLSDVKDGKGATLDAVLATLYLGEIYATQIKDDRRASELFNSVKELCASSDSQKDGIMNVYSAWAQHLGARIQNGGEKAAAIQPEQSKGVLFTVVTHAIVAGLYNDPTQGRLYQDERRALLDAQFRRYITDGVSDIDRDVIRLYYGSEYSQYDYGLPPSKEQDAVAEKQISDLFTSDSFWTPVAGMTLAYGRAVRGKTAESDATYEQVKQRFPEYESLIEQSKQSLAQQPPRPR